jgi:ribosomal protein L7Ae-like RNA K-turn-binding protein
VIVPDLRGRLPGRGLWVSASRAALDLAVKKRIFARAARAAVTVSQSLADEVEALLVRQVQNALGLAYKTGAVAAGFAKAEALLAKGRAAGLMEALDAGPHGAAKLRARAAQLGIPVVSILTAEEMGLALGRENMVHAGLGAERLGLRVLVEAGRLAGFRPHPAPPSDHNSAPESEES